MKTRRGLSTVIGAVFAIIAITTTIAYVSYSTNLLNQYDNTVLTKNQVLTDSDKEKFQITSVTTPGNPPKFNITVANTGSLPINFTKLWVQNTTTTDWTYSYVPSKAFVNPGGVVTNIGQSIPLYYKSTASYNIKLVTSRGNNQAFTVSSASSTPLNIQLLALPSTVTSGFTTELVMIVTNNGTGVLTNLIPQISEQPGFTATCTLGTVSPPSFNALSPGNTAIFKWDLKVAGNIGKSCTYVASLQNGFTSNIASTTVTLTPISAVSSNWSTSWGILSMNYTSLQWSQDGGNTWNNAWTLPHGPPTVWRVNIANNDPNRSFIFNGNSTLVAFGTSPGSNAATQFFIIKNNYPPTTAYPTNGQNVAFNSTGTLYFGASGAAGTGGVSFGNSQTGQYAISIILFGYWNSVANSNFFGQNIPYEGIIVS